MEKLFDDDTWYLAPVRFLCAWGIMIGLFVAGVIAFPIIVTSAVLKTAFMIR